MIKIKGLRPSLREKKRYIKYHVNTSKDIDMQSMQKSLIKQLSLMLGVFTPAGFLPIKTDQKTQTGIIRVNHTAVDLVRSCFVLINNIDTIPVSISTVRVSGILKKLG